VEVGDDHRVGSFPGLDEKAAIGVENHRVARANLVVIHAQAVAENEEQAVVVRAPGQPAQQPPASLVAAKLVLDRGRIMVAIVPMPAVDQAHQLRIFAADGTRLVRHQQNLGAA